MSHSFEHESDSIPSLKDPALCARLTVSFSVCPDSEDEAHAEDILVWNEETQSEVLLSQLSPEEQDSIERRCQDVATEHAHSSYYEARSALAEAARDASEDR